MSDARRAVEIAARDSYGRLLAWLASRGGDVQRAEDALGDALSAALADWPDAGVPANPEAWLLTAARRRVIDAVRREQTRELGAARLRQEAEELASSSFGPGLTDRRLELMFVCAHPAIDPAARTPLILQTVLGLPAARIASAMLVSPGALSQRLVRAKRKILEDGLAFEVPGADALPARLSAVLEAVYAVYGAAWGAQDASATGLAWEALWLARLLVDLLPGAAEPKGLFALLALCEARRDARRDASGGYVPLEQQDTTLWDAALILEGEKALWLAARQGQTGPFQLEASIQSVHVHRARSGHTDWVAIHRLYRVLVDQHPSLGAYVGYAASCARVDRTDEGLAVLDQLPGATVARHQPYWAVRAHLLGQAGRDASDALARAIGLAEDPAVRRWLAGR